MNIATIFGIIAGIVILCTATFFATDSVAVFINLPGLAIVLGGTVAATFICYPLKEVMRVFGLFMTAFTAEELPIANYIKVLVQISKEAASKGDDYLEKSLKKIDNEFLRDGLQMLVDGYDKEELREIFDNRIQQYHAQETYAAGIYRTMAALSPAFGIIGTLIGLIAMMQGMGDDITRVGPGMATALTTTLYGVLFANLFYLPIANKVERRVEERTILMCVFRDGILHIKDKTPAAIITDKLKGYLPPRKWSSIEAR
ncbi:motility protein A [Salidesulfovibrio onnuriiensis]|uniref:motility protein A n=1 Tax=Salidesulfovibrio onnuriiensis TaxID=2583823 RepID=UPI0011C70902|nr:MotA/TolQ/ExbB proton channel family protein [Salidesulfovibrio onnuriiensis]